MTIQWREHSQWRNYSIEHRKKSCKTHFQLILPKIHIILSHSRACTWLFTAYERRILNSRCELNFGLFISWHKIQLTCRFQRKKEKNTPSFGLWAFHSLNIETIAHVIYYVLHIRSHKDVWCVWKRCTYKFFGVPLSSLSHTPSTQHPINHLNPKQFAHEKPTSSNWKQKRNTGIRLLDFRNVFKCWLIPKPKRVAECAYCAHAQSMKSQSACQQLSRLPIQNIIHKFSSYLASCCGFWSWCVCVNVDAFEWHLMWNASQCAHTNTVMLATRLKPNGCRTCLLHYLMKC